MTPRVTPPCGDRGSGPLRQGALQLVEGAAVRRGYDPPSLPESIDVVDDHEPLQKSLVDAYTMERGISFMTAPPAGSSPPAGRSRRL
ncbi:MAG: hypothetical protein ACRERE_23130 [Candidatus Entotheonellia bacterium]